VSSREKAGVVTKVTTVSFGAALAGERRRQLAGAHLGRLARALARQPGADPGLGFGERRGAAGAPVEHLDQVQAVGGAHRTDHLPDLGAEGRVLELADHAAAPEVVEVAAALPAAGIVGILAGELFERRTGGELGAHFVHAGGRGRLVAVLVDVDQDVARAHLFGAGELRPVVLVPLLDLGGGDLERRAELRGVDQQVVDDALVRDAEVGAVGLEVGGDLLVARLRGREVAVGRHHDVAHLGALVGVAPAALDGGVGDRHRGHQRLGQLLDRQVLAYGVFELARRRVADRADEALVDVLADELAVGALEGGLRQQEAAHFAVADLEPATARLLGQQLAVDQPVERLDRQAQLLGELRRDVAAEGLPVLVLEPAVLALEGLVGDRRVADRRGRGGRAAGRPQRAAEVDEDEGDEHEDHHPQDPAEVLQVVAQDLEHRNSWGRRGGRIDRARPKGGHGTSGGARAARRGRGPGLPRGR